MSRQLVRFTLGPHRCGLPVLDVQEVLRIVAITKLPHAPAFIEGVVNLRGVVIPIIDLRRRLGLEPGPFDSATRIIVAALRGRSTGLIVDEVNDVADAASDIGVDPSEALGAGLSRYAARLVKSSDGLVVVVIDLSGVLSDEEGRVFDALVLGAENA